jgi:hypothetical protein
MRLVAALFALLTIASCSSTTAPRSYVPWLPLPRGNANITLPSPTAPVQVPPGTPRCAASQLEGRLLGSFGPAGRVNTPIAFRNTGSTACYVNGVPDLTIEDAQGQVLAKGDGIGTQFDQYIAAVDVLMEPGTPPLADRTSFGGGDALAPGQAYLNIDWIGCAGSPAAELVVGLPGGGGNLVVAFAVGPPDEQTCVYPASSQLRRDPLNPTGMTWPPPPQRISVQYSVDAPKSAHRGSTVEFFVTVRNTSSSDYALAPCPDYSNALVPGGPVTYHQLNCAPVGAIKAGRSVTFQMEFAIPDGTPTGPWALLFGFVDGRVDPTAVQTPITIT